MLSNPLVTIVDFGPKPEGTIGGSGRSFTKQFTHLGPGGYPSPPESFTAKPSFAGRQFTRQFTVLGPGGYPSPPESFTAKPPYNPTLVPVAPSPGGSISGGYFSRRKWHTLVGEMVEEAQAKALAARNRKLAAALREAARQARDATEYLAPDSDANAKALAETLQAAVQIKDANAAIERLAQVRHEAELLRQILDDDEEVAIMLLLS